MRRTDWQASKEFRPLQAFQRIWGDGIRMQLCTKYHWPTETLEDPWSHASVFLQHGELTVSTTADLAQDSKKKSDLILLSLSCVLLSLRISTRSRWQCSHTTSKKSIAKTTFQEQGEFSHGPLLSPWGISFAFHVELPQPPTIEAGRSRAAKDVP